MSSLKFQSRLLLGTLLAFSISLPMAFADLSPQTISNAITAANVLDADATMRVAVNGDSVYVSTYRNPSENDNDCKINAVLVAKAVFGVAGDSAARVTIYFYSATEPGKYREVSVSAGDVKAYGAGATSQDQLLQSIVVAHKQQLNDADKITQQLQNNAYSRPDYRVDTGSPTELVVTTVLGAWVPDVDAKLEAVRIANIAAQYAPSEVQTIKVSYRDPRTPGSRREIVLSKEDALQKWTAMQGALKDMPVATVQVPMDLASLEAVPGVALVERQTLLKRIRDAARLGIGTDAFLKAFQQIEASVPGGDEGAVKAAVMRLHGDLNEQADLYRKAKSIKFANVDANTGSPHVGSGKDLGRKRFWFHGQLPFAPDVIAADPDTVISKCEQLCGGAAKADKDPGFLELLNTMVPILKMDNNNAEANKVAARAAIVRRALGR